jgi:hypothetical protein
MSALNVTQDEADLILVGLNMYADVQRNASGAVSDDVKALITKITPAPVVESARVETAVAEPEVPVETPKAKKTKVVEE